MSPPGLPPAEFEPILVTSRPEAARAGTKRRFSVPEIDAAPPPPPPEPEPLPDPAAEAAAALAARLDAARAEGFADGEAATRALLAADEATREAAALEATARALAAAQADVRDAAGEATEAMARLLLAALDAALPEAAARLAPEAAARLAQEIAPLVAEGVAVALHVPPGLGDIVAARIGGRHIEVLEDPALRPGDARAHWRGGGATLSLDLRRQAVRLLLNAFDLQET